jgi:hypothetical protein
VNMEDGMRLDADVAMISVGFLLSSVVCYRKAPRYRSCPPIRHIEASPSRVVTATCPAANRC